MILEVYSSSKTLLRVLALLRLLISSGKTLTFEFLDAVRRVLVADAVA